MGMTATTGSALGSSVRSVSSERRKHARYAFTAAAEAIETGSGTRIQGRTADLSRGGCYVDTMNPFPADTIVKLRLTKESRSFEAQAQVVYSIVGLGMGMAFTAVDPEQKYILERWTGESGDGLPLDLDAPVQTDQILAPGGSNNEQSYVLSELVIELMRQGVLSNEKGKAMLEKLLRLSS